MSSRRNRVIAVAGYVGIIAGLLQVFSLIRAPSSSIQQTAPTSDLGHPRSSAALQTGALDLNTQSLKVNAGISKEKGDIKLHKDEVLVEFTDSPEGTYINPDREFSSYDIDNTPYMEIGEYLDPDSVFFGSETTPTISMQIRSYSDPDDAYTQYTSEITSIREYLDPSFYYNNRPISNHQVIGFFIDPDWD